MVVLFYSFFYIGSSTSGIEKDTFPSPNKIGRTDRFLQKQNSYLLAIFCFCENAVGLKEFLKLNMLQRCLKHFALINRLSAE